MGIVNSKNIDDVIIYWFYGTLLMTGSSTANRGRVRLDRTTGVQTYFFLACSPAQPREENRHGPHHRILPQSRVPCQRANRPRQYWYPFAEGATVHLSRVSQDVQRHQRHGLLSAAHRGRDRGPRRDLARPWLSRTSHCGSFWIR